MSLERDRVCSPPAPAAPPSPCPAPPGPAQAARQLRVLEEKLRFSQFLDEITTRVLSPANLHLLGGRGPVGGRGKAAPLGQQPDPKDRPDRLDRRSWASEDLPEQPRRERDARPQTWLVPLQRDGWDAEPELEQRRGRACWREGARPKTQAPSRGRTAGAGPHEVHLRQRHRDPADEAETPKYTYPAPLAERDRVLGSPFSVFAQIQESLCDSDRIKILQQQNEDLRRRLTHTTHKMEAMETEFQSSRHFMQAEIGRSKDDLEKMRDKFRRLQNSYTASQRANQDLEEKLHALLRKVERDKKTMDQEIVELTNKLLDAKNTIDKLEELNERYRQDCNLAVQLLKCNKSHFRNHKFADLPYELQDMVNKHMKTSLPDRGAQAQDPDSLSLTPADVVPTSVIARVLEKPEPLVLNSAQSSSSAGRPVAEDVFVHVDMTGPPPGGEGGGGGGSSGSSGQENGGQGLGLGRQLSQDQQQQLLQQQNGMSRSQTSLDGHSGEEGGGGGGPGPVAPSFEKLNPYPTPPPPHPLYPGRKVIEFSSDDKVKIPKNSPLPNCTYATRQAISLSLVQNEEEAVERQRTVPNSPAVSEGGWRSGASSSSGGHPRGPPQPDAADPLSSQSSPFSSPPQAPSAFASSGSSEEDLLANWQRMFVEKMAPASQGTLVSRTSFSSETVKDLEGRQNGKAGGDRDRDRGLHRGAYSDGEESSPQSWTASRGSSLDTDTGSSDLRGRKAQYGGDCSQEESERLLMGLDPLDDGDSCDTAVTVATALEQAGPAGPASPASRRREFVDGGSAGSSAEERDVLPQDFPAIAPRALPGLEDFAEKPPPPPPLAQGPARPQKSPKRMGVHHLHRKDSLTRAQEHGNLLD
ncbi:tight junction-associated protein 1 isoform X2 [Anguilla rostrata]|uniref:tight junction-associated protein 1 isoform X2 n=1 Tax=Anguilla rostrata TaxID=7938 RepID=UPI0030CEDD7F